MYLSYDFNTEVETLNKGTTMDVEGFVILPMMMIKGERVGGISFTVSRAYARMYWNGETFETVVQDPQYNVTYDIELELDPHQPQFKVERFDKLYITKIGGAILLAVQWTWTDGQVQTRLFPYDPIADRIWYYSGPNEWPNGTKWAYMDLSGGNGKWNTTEPKAPPLEWSSNFKINGLPSWEP